MDIITDLWKKTRIQMKCAFFSSFLFGVMSHGMGLFNKYSNNDDLRYFFDAGETLTLGRWMLYILARCEKYLFGDGKFSLPVIHGFTVIVCIGIMTCLLIDLFDIRSTTLCILLGGLMVSFPVVTCMFGYMFTAHYYGIGLLLSVLGPYLILKKDRWWYFLAGVVITACSVGIYQAFIPVTLCVFLCAAMKNFADASGREGRNRALKKTAASVFSCPLFMGLYFLLMKGSLRYSGAALSNYKSASSYNQVTIKEYFRRAVLAYKEFLSPSGGTWYDVQPGNLRLFYYILLVGIILLYAALLWSKRKEPLNVFILAFLLLWVPLGVNFIFVITKEPNVFAMMVYGRTMLFLLFAWLIEKMLGMLRSVPARAVQSVCLGILGITALMYCRFSNVCYLRMELMQSQAIRYFSTLVTRIQSTEGYDPWKYVSYIYFPHPGNYDNSIEEIPELEYIKIHPYFGTRLNISDNIWRKFLQYWCGFTAHEVDQSFFVNRPEVQAMPHYPSEGSIKVIDDTVVVKF